VAKRQNQLDEYNEALKGITPGALPLICVVYGGDEFFRRRALLKIQNAAKKNNKEIETVSFHGKAANETQLPVSTVLEELSGTGLFCSEKIVEVRRADRFLFPASSAQSAGSSSKGGKSSALDKLCEYIENPRSGIYLVFECEKLNRKLKPGKALAKNATLISCPQLRWESEVKGWLRKEASSQGNTLTHEAVDMLYSVYGNDVGALSGEVQKLSVFAKGEAQIDGAVVRELMGATTALTGFELTNAVEAKDVAKAMKVARVMIVQGVSDQKGKNVGLTGTVHMALGSLRNCVLRIWRAHDVVARGGSIGDIEAEFNTRGKRAEVMFEAGRSYRLHEIKNALDAIAGALEGLHDTGGDCALTLEKTVLQICGR
jgi:DNA polymerase III delta subunit